MALTRPDGTLVTGPGGARLRPDEIQNFETDPPHNEPDALHNYLLFTPDSIDRIRADVTAGRSMTPVIVQDLLRDRDTLITTLKTMHKALEDIEIALCSSHPGCHPECTMGICTHPLRFVRQALGKA